MGDLRAVVLSGVCEYCGHQMRAAQTEEAANPVARMVAATCKQCGRQVTLRRRRPPAAAPVRDGFHPAQR